MVGECLNSSLKMTNLAVCFEGFKVDIKGLEVFQIQYVDDMEVVGVPPVESINIKVVLRGKSYTFDINVGLSFSRLG